MTAKTGGEWKREGKYIFSEHGNICVLSDPGKNDSIEYVPLKINSPNWDEAIENGKLIIDAVKAYRQILQLFGPEWEAELKRLEEIAKEM